MPESISNDYGFRVEPATELDWSWIRRSLLETSMDTLAPSLRDTEENVVNEHLSEEVENIRGPKGFSNQAFIAKDPNGSDLGFIWVAETRENFTGLRQAFVLLVYVDKSCRGRGIGKKLMKLAEAWARDRNLRRIALSVSIKNEKARRLYESLGYIAETQVMGKSL